MPSTRIGINTFWANPPVLAATWLSASHSSNTIRFSPDLGAGSLIGGGDEFSMFVKVLKHGYRIRHVPSAAVTHVLGDNLPNRKARTTQLDAGSVAFALKLLMEEKTLRWLFSGVKRRARRVLLNRTFSTEPQELLSPGERLLACLKGVRIYWESRQI